MTQITIEEKKLNHLVRRPVIAVIQEVLTDPDYGLSLTSEAIKRLKRSIRSKKAGRLIPFEQILKKY